MTDEPQPDSAGWYSFEPAPLLVVYAVTGEVDAASLRHPEAIVVQLSSGGAMLCRACGSHDCEHVRRCGEALERV